MRQGLLRSALLLTILGGFGVYLKSSCMKCPTDDSYSPECLKSVIPPWPICLFHDVPTFVEHSEDAATRCCKEDGDLSECKCPHKDSEKFIDHIDEWCEGVAACSASFSFEEDMESEELVGLE
uniref:Uncharacterized protein n=1 Tax=Ditylum brightwellii TaxID=49249 RepID=A0A6V2FJ27_9STRA|mmetsp:Transcript_40525/g.60750  ORF Transcript_40525/g.60750 Transcript_40525/m.60750 type:complete len:123 (-) Transcript_40525:419-787(-)